MVVARQPVDFPSAKAKTKILLGLPVSFCKEILRAITNLIQNLKSL